MKKTDFKSLFNSLKKLDRNELVIISSSLNRNNNTGIDNIDSFSRKYSHKKTLKIVNKINDIMFGGNINNNPYRSDAIKSRRDLRDTKEEIESIKIQQLRQREEISKKQNELNYLHYLNYLYY